MRSALFVLSFLSYFSFFAQRGNDTINWKETPLTWDDFKGKPERRFAAASTSYDILKHVYKKDSKNATVKIEAVFFCKDSWKKSSWINDQVLAHEQKHFDIVELYARKLRKTLSETKFSSLTDLEEKIQSLYDANDKAMDQYQDQYDDETDGSMNGDKQREWQASIIKDIKALDAYKEVTLQINFSK